MAEEKIDKNMTLGEILAKYPESAEVMLRYGLHCIGCHVASWETLEQGAKVHGLDDKQVEQLVKDIEKQIEEKKKE